jgi:hypothetical protein
MFQLWTGRMLNTANDDFPDVEDPEHNLQQETTDFLTQLSQSLSG